MKDLGGPRPKYAVILLTDAKGNVGHVGVRRLDRPARWEPIWRLKNQIDTPLSRWLRTLDNRPTEIVLLGSVGMHARTARAAAAALRAGWFPGAVGGGKSPGRRRWTAKIAADGSLTAVWPSQAAAARSLGVTRWAVWRGIRTGRFLDLGELTVES